METLADKLIQIAENEQKVYNAGYEKGKSEGSDVEGSYNQGFDDGKQAEYDAFWDKVQQNGNRTGYAYGFAGASWTDETYDPKYEINCATLQSANSLFMYSEVTDAKVTITLNGTRNNQSFYGSKLKRIPLIRLVGNVSFNSSFTNCTNLVYIRFSGAIQNDIDLHWSPLDADSLISIINALEDKAFSTKISGSWKFNDSWVGDCDTIERNLNYSVEGDEHAFNIVFINSPTIAQAVNDEEVQGSIAYVVELNGKTVDFGATSQTISTQAAEWIAQNATSQGGSITTETGTVWTVTLGTTNLAKLTDAEKAIATQKGWTLA